MRKNKKSQWLMYGLMAGLIGAIIVSVEYSGKAKDFNIVGDYALSLVSASKEAEKALFYIDQSAKYSLQQAIYDIAQNGGVSEVENIGTDEAFADYKCGKFKDSYIWYEVKKTQDNYDLRECFDETSVSSYLLYLFDKNLNQYISSAPKEMPIDNYNYEIKDNSEIIGIAKEPIKFDIWKYEKETEYKPSQPRQFKVDSQGKVIVEKKTAETKIPEKGKETPEDKAKIKLLVDFSDSTSATLGKETIDITGLCPKGKTCYLTNEAFNLLLQAQKKAKEKGKYLQVNSAFRTYKQQKDLWEGNTPERYAQRFPDPIIRSKYVSDPDKCSDKCSHFTGNAVDVVFKDKITNTMTGADWKQLSDIMTSVGWVRYGDERDSRKGEAWHFECCNTQRYVRAKEQGVTAIV